MNADQKKKLLDHKCDIVAVMHSVDDILTKEEEYQINLPLWNTDEFERVESIIFYLESIKNSLNEAYEYINKVAK